MSAGACVLGVLGWCRVGSGNPTQPEPPSGGRSGGLCRVCWVFTRAGACAQFSCVIQPTQGNAFFSTCEDRKTQQTQHTPHNYMQCIVFKGFCVCWVCVGLEFFVLGWVFGWGAGA